MCRSTPGSLIKPALCWRSSAGVCRRGGLLCLSLLVLITVHPFADATVAAQSSVRWIASSAAAPDAVRERMTGLLRDHIGRVLTLNPPESLTIAAARDALRSADPSQTLFLVTDSAGLNDLMATNGWRDMARVGPRTGQSADLGPHALRIRARRHARSTVAAQGLGALGGSRVTRGPQPGSGGRASLWATSTSPSKR